MKRLAIIIILLTSFSVLIFPQFSKLLEIKTSSGYFSIDYRNTIYFTEGEYLYKSEPPYQTKSSFFLGKQDPNYHIDISNPNQILIFFPEIQKIIILDSALQETSRPLYLNEIGKLDISLVCSTSKNGYWFYNQANNTLTGMDARFIPKVKAFNLDGFYNYPKIPTFLCAQNDKIFLNIPSEGVLIMSDLGRFITMVSLTGLVDFQVSGDDIIFYRDDHIFIYNIKKQDSKTISLPDVPDIINALYSINRIFLQTKDKIMIFSYH